MTQAVVLILAGVTSMAAVLVGTRGLGLRRVDLRAALVKALECVGLILAFFAANAILGLTAIILGRTMTGIFVSSYVVSDATLLGVSFLQGIVFHCWRETSRGDREGRRGEEAKRR